MCLPHWKLQGSRRAWVLFWAGTEPTEALASFTFRNIGPAVPGWPKAAQGLCQQLGAERSVRKRWEGVWMDPLGCDNRSNDFDEDAVVLVSTGRKIHNLFRLVFRKRRVLSCHSFLFATWFILVLRAKLWLESVHLRIDLHFWSTVWKRSDIILWPVKVDSCISISTKLSNIWSSQQLLYRKHKCWWKKRKTR